MQLPRLYPIVDARFFATSKDLYVFCEELSAGGVTLLQYRNKSGDARLMLEHAVEIKRLIGSRVKLIMNDRADLCLAAGFDGVHVGQDDLSPEGGEEGHRSGANAWGFDAQRRTIGIGRSDHGGLSGDRAGI